MTILQIVEIIAKTQAWGSLLYWGVQMGLILLLVLAGWKVLKIICQDIQGFFIGWRSSRITLDAKEFSNQLALFPHAAQYEEAGKLLKQISQGNGNKMLLAQTGLVMSQNLSKLSSDLERVAFDLVIGEE